MFDLGITGVLGEDMIDPGLFDEFDEHVSPEILIQLDILSVRNRYYKY